MSIRLTKFLRAHILYTAQKQTFEARKRALDLQGNAVYMGLYNLHHGSHLGRMAALPEEFLPPARSIRFVCKGGENLTISPPENSHLRVANNFFPQEYYNSFSVGRVDTDYGIVHATPLRRLIDEYLAYKADENKFKEGLSSVLKSATTFEGACNLWPELSTIMIGRMPAVEQNKQLALPTATLTELYEKRRVAEPPAQVQTAVVEKVAKKAVKKAAAPRPKEKK